MRKATTNTQYQHVLQLSYNHSLLELSIKFWKAKIQVKSLLKGGQKSYYDRLVECPNHRGEAYFGKSTCF